MGSSVRCSPRCRRGPSWPAGWPPTTWFASSPRRSLRHRPAASPARDFKVLAPDTPLTTAGRPTQRTIDPASYRRYDGLVGTVTSIDASAVAKIYRTIRPRLNEAYRSMGNADRDVDNAVRNALDILLDTPVVKGPDPRRRRRRRELGLRRSGSRSADADAEAAGAHGPGAHGDVAGVVTRFEECAVAAATAACPLLTSSASSRRRSR